MNKPLILSTADREFFGLVARAAFANPFTAERSALDEQIMGAARTADRAARLDQVVARVRERLRRLAAAGADRPRAYAAADELLLRTAHLFDVFHRHLADFDRLLRDQLPAEAESLPVPFARDALAALTQRGFPEADAIRFLAMFYQLRRAFYFIDRGLTGESPSLRQLRAQLWNNVFTRDIRLYERHLWERMEDFSTLLLGETGSGKGAAAAAIGRSGFIPFDAAQGRFVESFMRGFTALNLSQYPASLIESELFGHRKGAFTGAVEAHEGVFARCSPHGAIFLDEIGDVAAPVQIKLLQVLQDRTFTPVGSHERRRFAGRVIAATNRPLAELRRQGAFRDDFYYRLCSDVIEVPPLRQRLREDPRELDRLLRLLVARLIGAEHDELARDIRVALRRSPGPDYRWPGNVRELEQAVRRSLLTGRYAGQPAPDAVAPGEKLQAGIAAGALDAEQLLAGYCALLYRRHGTYEEVARRTRLDRRTAKRYVLAASPTGQPGPG
ncbi:MAG: sigma 54-interacting transcriptional regulator [Kiritimatiellaeota bacterium]|nr:sigma 54-interacting transcriptional regulator [Kiritimatiellota bacterium]